MNSVPGVPRGRSFAIAIAAYALIICLTAIRSGPPAPKAVDAPATEFSGARARIFLQKLVGDGVPHPVGSEQSAVVRARIVSELTQLGYQPQVRGGFACDAYGTCAEVKNVIARLDGQEAGPAVMVAAHYDSVPAGPGASDDGVGAASVLEIARALKAIGPPRHPVIFLLDEGEEAGLLGAVAFVQDDPWAKDVRAAVNMDNRGTSGPSAMFETGSANGWLMRMYAKTVQRPDATSIFYAVYKLLPNDTDFTVFKRAGYQGFNFAFIGDVAHYHTPLDDFANASANSIQQEGGSALMTLRALANSNLQFGGDSEAVFFDLFGWKTIWWPAQKTIYFAALSLALLIIEIVILLRRQQMRMKNFLWGVVSWPAMILASGIVGGILYFLLRAAGALPTPWVAHPSPMLIAFWALGFLVAATLGLTFWRFAGFWGLWSGVWIWWVMAAVVLGLLAPAYSYIFVAPALAAGICGLAILFERGDGGFAGAVATIVPAVVAAAIAIEAIWFLYDALGGISLIVIAILVALISTPVAPLAGTVSAGRRWFVPGVLLAAVIIGAGVALFFPLFSANSPESLDLEYFQNADNGKTYWMANPASGRLPRTLINAGDFSNKRLPIYPWSAKGAFAADAPALNFAAPELTVRSVSSLGGKWRYDVLLRSPRGAPVLSLAFPPDAGVESVSIQGQAIPELSRRLLGYTHGWRPYTCRSLPAEGIDMQFTLASAKPVQLFLLDESFGLPPQGAFLQRARPATAVPIQDGDATLVTRHVTLKPQ